MSGILNIFVGGTYSSAPVNTVAPVVSGTATVGQTLSSTTGTWTGLPTPTFTYQWQRAGSNIGGATSSTYVLVADDYANTIRCVVTATNVVSAVSANSNSTASVAGNAPVNTVAPLVTGTATVGQTLTTTNGTWTGVPTPTFTYQWQRVTTNISGATSSTYVLVNADAGNSIRCVVTATNAVSAVSANSNSTASVAAIVPTAPTIGTATQTGYTTATVTYTASSSDGGATITSYTAVSSPSGITGTLSTSGSGTITVSGLNANTSYTFTVFATNSVGNSPSSASSNSITTPAITFYTSRSLGVTEGAESNYLTDVGTSYLNLDWGYGGNNSDIVYISIGGNSAKLRGFTIGNYGSSGNSMSGNIVVISGQSTNGTQLANNSFTSSTLNTTASGQTLFTFPNPPTLVNGGTYCVGFVWAGSQSIKTYRQLGNQSRYTSTVSLGGKSLTVNYWPSGASPSFNGSAGLATSNGTDYTNGGGNGQVITFFWEFV